ncbi:biopolymer transporter ExbD [bacterium]|nr:biopolymer transporter ExbD [bacterium]
MARKPSLRTNRIRPSEGLNLAPLIDMVSVLMFFLLAFAGIIPVSIIDAPLPKIASTAEEVKQANKKDNKLELTVDISPTSVVVREDGGAAKTFAANEKGEFAFDEMHKHFIALHGRKPKSHEITLVPQNAVTYDTLIKVMDSSRELVKGDPGYQELPPGGAQAPESAAFNRLFPDVSIGGV